MVQPVGSLRISIKLEIIMANFPDVRIKEIDDPEQFLLNLQEHFS